MSDAPTEGAEGALPRAELLTTSKQNVPGQARAPPGNARAPQGALLVVICVARLLRCPAQARGRWSNTEQEVVDRVVRDKLRREHGLSLESAGFRKFLVSIGETKKNAKKRRLAAADEGDSDS